MVSLKSGFSRFLGAAPERLHFAAHSHHPWPDVSFEAQQQAWLDAARHADLKWGKVFGDVMPAAQRHIARVLNLPDPRTIAFAPNTHEFVLRLLSCLPRPVRVLTTDGEFHSFTRQIQRLEEDDLARVTRVTVEPHGSFAQRFAEAAARGGFDLVWFSEVFFNSGLRVTALAPLVAAVKDPATFVVVDGYHAFMAVPTDLSALAPRIFYLAGGYKYAMAGEGACFMHCPPDYGERPRNTGWYASFGTLAHAQSADVQYAPGGGRFLGATFDPTGLYRFVAVQEWLKGNDVGVAQVQAHVAALQQQFLAGRERSALLKDAELLPAPGLPRGNFLTLRDPGAQALHDRLLAAGILVDCRADRLRIGFGLHLDESDIDAFFRRIVKLA